MKLSKKIASILLCGAMVTTLLTGCGKSDEGASDSAAKILSHMLYLMTVETH